MTLRETILLLTVSILLFEADLFAHDRSSRSPMRRAFATSALPLLVAFLIVVYRRWHHFQ